MPRASGVANSADRRAWLRSYHYYRAILFEQPAGAEAMELCRAVLEATDLPVPDLMMSDGPPTEPLASRDGAVSEAAIETPASLARRGTPAGIHDGLPFFKEENFWAEPWRLNVSAERMLTKLAKDASRGKDAEFLLPDPGAWKSWAIGVKGKPYAIGALRGVDVLKGLWFGGVLTELGKIERRRIIWQIGPSAVVARTMKLRFPDTTTLIACKPIEMPSSVAFLRASFPDAAIRVVADGTEAIDWAADDFVFVPISAAPTVTPPSLDLVIDVLALQTTDGDTATSLVDHAFDLGALYFYSLAFGGTSPDWPMADVRPLIERRFWMHQLPIDSIIDWSVAAMMDEGYAARGWIKRPEDVKYWKLTQQYLVGWRRVAV